MGIKEKVEYLKTTKNLIRNAIVSKGVDFSEDTPFRDYASKIGLIESGKIEPALSFGPYSHSPIDEASLEPAVPAGKYYIPTDFPEYKEYQMDPTWYDLEAILEADTHDYPVKMIVQYCNYSKTSTLYGADYYIQSDGFETASNELTDTITVDWDRSKDRLVTETFGYRYVIYCFSDPSRVSYVQRRYRTIGDDAVAVITKGFKWSQTTSSTNGNAAQYQPFSNFSRLRYVKLIDSDYSDIRNMSAWFYQSASLEYVDLGIMDTPSIFNYCFSRCYSLEHVKMKISECFYSARYMFEYCYNLYYAELDFSLWNPCRDVDARNMFENSGINYAKLIFDNNKDYIKYPWIQLKADKKLKVSKIEYTNAYQSNGQHQDPAKDVEVLASNDGLNWTSMGHIKPSLWAALAKTTIEVDNTNAYQYWRFRAVDKVGSQWSVQNIELIAEYENEDGDWVEWTQPDFNSDREGGCILSCSGEYDSEHYLRYAFNSNMSRYNYYKAADCSIGVATGSFGVMFDNCNSLQTVYIAGGHNLSYIYCGNWDHRYIIFEDTSNFTSFSTTFYNCTRMWGAIIPDTSKVTSWYYAFQNCSELGTAPVIKFTSNVINVNGMFSGSIVSNTEYLSGFDALKTAYGLFRQCNVEVFNKELTNATSIDYMFRDNASVSFVCFKAPKLRSMAYTFSNATTLDKVKIYGYNQEEVIEVPYSRPNCTSNTSHGEITADSSLSYEGRLWSMFTSANYNSSSFNSDGCFTRFNGIGCVYWKLPKSIKVSELAITSGYSTIANIGFSGRFWGDAEKTIPLTEEFTIQNKVWTRNDIPVINDSIEIDTIVLEITSNTYGWASIGQIDINGTTKTSGYLTNMEGAFQNSLAEFIDVDPSKVENMNRIFESNQRVSCLPKCFINNVPNVKTISYAFNNSGIAQLANVEFPNVTNASYAFNNCTKLTTVDNIKLPSCTNMDYAFQGSGIQRLTAFDAPEVQTMMYAFNNCQNLVELDLSQMTKLTNCDSLARECPSLKKVHLPGSVENLNYAFSNDHTLSDFLIDDTTHITNLDNAFYCCCSLQSIVLDIPECTTMHNCFYFCENLASVDLIDLSKVQDMSGAFYGCHYLTSIVLPDMYECTSMNDVFGACHRLVSAKIGSIPKATDLQYLFDNCHRLTSVEFTDSPVINDLSYAFRNCRCLEEVDIPSTASCRYFNYTFDGCNHIKRISEIDQSSAVEFNSTFRFCYELLESPLKKLSGVSVTQALFQACHSITDWSFLENFNMGSVNNSSYMFRNCLFKELSFKMISNNSTCNMNCMFDNNPNLESITIDFGNRTQTGTHQYMFQNCPKLRDINLVNTNGFNNFGCMFANSYIKHMELDFNNYNKSHLSLDNAFNNCPNLEAISLDFGNHNYSSCSCSNQYMVANCPNLRSINISGADYTYYYNYMFAGMTNKHDCILDWGGSTLRLNNLDFYRAFAYTVSPARLIHQNLNWMVATTPGAVFDNSIWSYFRAEAQVYEAYIQCKFPVTVQLNGVNFVQITSTDLYHHPNWVKYYKDLDMTDLIASDELDDSAGGNTLTEIDGVETDTLACVFGKNLGRFLSVATLDVKAKVKAKVTTSTWTQPVFSSNTTWGTVSASSAYYPAWRALNRVLGGTNLNADTWQTNNATSGWWQWLFKDELIVSNIRVYNRAFDGSHTTNTIKIIDTETGEIIQDTLDMVQEVNGYVDVSFETPKALKGIRIYVEGTSYVGIGEVSLTATINEYEFYDWSTPAENGIQIVDLPLKPEYAVGSSLSCSYEKSTDSRMHQAFYECFRPIIDVPDVIANITYTNDLFDLGDSSSRSRSCTRQVIKHIDFSAVTASTSNRSSWFDINDNDISTPSPCALEDIKNIRMAIGYSEFSLTHDSIIQILNALMSRVGLDAHTLRLGSVNLGKITDEEKAIALEKNWNLS